MKKLFNLLLLLPALCNAQGLINMGATTAGINLHTGYRTPAGLHFTAGYSFSMLSASKPQIADITVGKVIAFNKVELIPGVGVARYKRDLVANNDLFPQKPTLQPMYSLQVHYKMNFGSAFISANYCKGFYVGGGINAFVFENKTTVAPTTKKWWIPDTKEVIAYSLYGASGLAKGFHDAMIFHHWGTGKFWGPDQWENKYKNWPADQREAFPGSKTIFVFATDGVHLTNMIDVAFISTGTIINFGNIKTDLQQYPHGKRLLAFATKKIIYPILFRALFFETAWNTLNSKP